MPNHNDLDRATHDQNYRSLYEGDRAIERLDRTFPRPKEEEPKPKKKERQPWEPWKEGEKVICTELHRQGLLGREDYLLGLRFVREHLTPRHERGYHAWAIAVVRRMRRSPRWTSFWSRLATARADHIAFLYGDASRRNRAGAVLCAIGHPLCYLIGSVVGEQDWRALYRKEPPASAVQ